MDWDACVANSHVCHIMCVLSCGYLFLEFNSAKRTVIQTLQGMIPLHLNLRKLIDVLDVEVATSPLHKFEF